jgi:hypothetical protein
MGEVGLYDGWLVQARWLLEPAGRGSEAYDVAQNLWSTKASMVTGQPI